MTYPTSDTKNRPYLAITDAVEGMVVELDDGFLCHPKGLATVHIDNEGRPYFYCDNGEHLLYGQCDDGTHCIGVYPCPSPSSP